MRSLFFVPMVLAVTSFQAFATLTENDIEVDPVIEHHYNYDAESGLGDVEDWVDIVLPDVTLSSGDVFRVNVSFADGKFLKVINGASNVSINSHYITALLGSVGSTKTNNGLVGLEITSSVDVLNTEQAGTPACYYYSSTDAYYFNENFRFRRDEGAIVDGSLFGDFTIEFTAPTTLDGAPFLTDTFTFNSVRIKADLINTAVDKYVFEVVPEPATVLFLGLGVIGLRRRSCVCRHEPLWSL